MCGYSALTWPLAQGSVGTWLASLLVACGVMLLLGLALERRWLRPGEMPLAFWIGDPALAIGDGLGVHLLGHQQPCGVLGPRDQAAIGAAWLLFGLWQWRAEVRANLFTPAQALSPTKIWHQVAIYPTFGTWSAVAITGGLASVGRDWPAEVLMIACAAIWAITCVHTLRHPRLSHPPYDWRHLRPFHRPWDGDSITLRSVADNRWACRTPAGLAGTPEPRVIGGIPP
jgi:hypothetical protein